MADVLLISTLIFIFIMILRNSNNIIKENFFGSRRRRGRNKGDDDKKEDYKEIFKAARNESIKSDQTSAGLIDFLNNTEIMITTDSKRTKKGKGRRKNN